MHKSPGVFNASIGLGLPYDKLHMLNLLLYSFNFLLIIVDKTGSREISTILNWAGPLCNLYVLFCF